jgi:adenylate kinase family enzyme
MNRRIYISGASGAGVSTLGATLAAKLQVPHFDVDDYYWYPTEPPFEQSRPPAERVNLLNQSLIDGQWILSGSLDGWGDEVIQGADLVVFIDTPTSLRIERLKARESLRYGERILPRGDMHAKYLAFVAWAESYEGGTQAGRNRPRHERWLKQLAVPSLRVNGELPIEQLLVQVIAAIPD